MRTALLLPMSLFVVASAAHAQLLGVPSGYIDRKLEACTDFDAYASGQWRNDYPMPATESIWSPRTLMRDATQARLRAIAEDDAAHAARLPVDAPGRLTGEFYAGCMDQARIDALGLQPLNAELARIARVRTTGQIVGAILRLHDVGVAAPLQFDSMRNIHDTSQVIANVDAGGLSLPDRDYYLRDEPRFKTMREQYVGHVRRVFAAAGSAAAEAEQAAAIVLRMETTLARAWPTRVQLRDRATVDHLMSLAELQALAPRVNWLQAFKHARIPPQGQLNVGVPALLQAFDRLLAEAPAAEWRIYLRWRLLDSMAQHLSRPFVDEQFSFHSTAMSGVTEQRPRWQQCVIATDQWLGEALGREYVERHVPAAAKQRATQMAVNIVEELKRSVETREWMSPPTKARALEKVAALRLKIGYPERWKDYAGVKPDRRDFAASVLRARRHAVRDDLGQIGKPVDHTRWSMTPPTINAYYSPTLNEIVIPAGYLQPPGFNADGLDAINYGAVGVSIGHEISHGVDDQGARYTADGRFENWWTTEDYEQFKARTACTTQQYAAFEAEPGLHLDGKLVTGEALADLGGISLAYRAYQRSRAALGPEPVTDGFTPEQQFFLAVAHWRGSSIRPEEARQRATTDPHPLGRFRVLGPLSNMAEFRQAFQCRDGQPMVRKASDSCGVW